MNTGGFPKSAGPKDLLLYGDMKKLFISVLLIAMACAEPVVEKPEDLVPKETMVNLLYDLSIIHAAKGLNPQILKEGDKNTMEFLFEKYGLDSARYMQSDLYYASLPDEYEAIYGEVVERLEKTKNIIEEERKRINDSVKEAVRRRKQTPLADSITRTSGDELP